LGPDVPMHFTAFHPAWRMLDTPPTPIAAVQRARRIARESGVHHAYTGNAKDPDGGTTYCHGCGRALIRRRGYSVTQRRLSAEGRCYACGVPCAGVFSFGSAS
jgi:pyruvate formate lyase activating enzyme